MAAGISRLIGSFLAGGIARYLLPKSQQQRPQTTRLGVCLGSVKYYSSVGTARGVGGGLAMGLIKAALPSYTPQLFAVPAAPTSHAACAASRIGGMPCMDRELAHVYVESLATGLISGAAAGALMTVQTMAVGWAAGLVLGVGVGVYKAATFQPAP